MLQHAIDNQYIEWLIKHSLSYGFNILHYENGVLYEEIDEFHDLFRVGDYPETTLHSFEETTEFIENNKVKGDIYWDELKKFWEKYPDGLITFG